MQLTISRVRVETAPESERFVFHGPEATKLGYAMTPIRFPTTRIELTSKYLQTTPKLSNNFKTQTATGTVINYITTKAKYNFYQESNYNEFKEI